MQLCLHLFDEVVVDVHIAEGVDKFARLQTAYLCHHHSEEGVRRDVERYAEKHICTALVELLQEAIDNEDYEKAAKIRDEINSRNL